MKKLLHTEEFVASKLGKLLYPLIRPIADRVLGFHAINEHYTRISAKKPNTSGDFCRETLITLEGTPEYDPELRKALATEGPLIVVGNHPYGAIDSMAVMYLVDQESPSPWQMLANQLLRNITEMSANAIPVFPHAAEKNKGGNLKAIKDMHKTLKRGEVLIMFPAARVSGIHPEHGFVCDLPWTSHPITLAAKHQAKIVFCHISGHNSDKFLAIPPIKLRKRSIALAKEVIGKKGTTFSVNHSFTMSPELATKVSKFENKEEVIRALSYIGADKTPAKPSPQLGNDLSPYLSESSKNFQRLLSDTLEPLIDQPHFSSFLLQGKDQPAVMQEIGSLRAKTFKAIGAGSGNAIDLSPEDDYYHHIIVTEKASGKIAGAYRVGFSESIRDEQGEGALYLNSVFSIDNHFYEHVNPAMELSRSFIPPEFQKSPQVLDILWKSLGNVAKSSGCKTLYGSVTISADFSPLSQAILVDTLDRYYSAPSEVRKYIKNSNPFEAQTTYHKLITDAYAPHGLNRLNTVIEEIEDHQRPIPPLMRYYSTLGAEFHSFKVEPTFGNAIYCLLTVHIDTIPQRYKKRFLGS